MNELSRFPSLPPRLGAFLGLGLLGFLLLPACGSGDDSGSTGDGSETDGDGTDGDGTDGDGTDGNGEKADACADSAPETACADGWLCKYGSWECADATSGTGGNAGSTDPTTDLDGTSCEPGSEVSGQCSTCFCGESEKYSCIYLPNCDSENPDPEPDPERTPEGLEGTPCTAEEPYVQFDCATCYCTDASVYMCAYIADCGEPYPYDSCLDPQPTEQCDAGTGWICDWGEWVCGGLKL